MNNSTSNEDVVAKAEAHLKYVDEFGKKTFGVSSDCSPQKPPSWYDPVKFKRAQDLYQTFGVVYVLFE